MFVLFDIESLFLFPWAVSYGGLGAFALWEMAIFLVMLLIGLVYAWAKGVLRGLESSRRPAWRLQGG